jgi:hypothetical protein
MATKTIRVRQGAAIDILEKVERADGLPVTEDDVLSIALYVYDSNGQELARFAMPTTLVSDTIQSTPRKVYNFAHTLSPWLLVGGATKQRVEYVITVFNTDVDDGRGREQVVVVRIVDVQQALTVP